MDIQTELTQLSQEIQRLRSKLETGEATRGYNLALDRVLKAVQTRTAGLERRDGRERAGTDVVHNCPFCGEGIVESEERLTVSIHEEENGVSHAVNCKSCGAHGPWMPTVAQAIRSWNSVAMTFQALGKRHGD